MTDRWRLPRAQPPAANSRLWCIRRSGTAGRDGKSLLCEPGFKMCLAIAACVFELRPSQTHAMSLSVRKLQLVEACSKRAAPNAFMRTGSAEAKRSKPSTSIWRLVSSSHMMPVSLPTLSTTSSIWAAISPRTRRSTLFSTPYSSAHLFWGLLLICLLHIAKLLKLARPLFLLARSSWICYVHLDFLLRSFFRHKWAQSLQNRHEQYHQSCCSHAVPNDLPSLGRMQASKGKLFQAVPWHVWRWDNMWKLQIAWSTWFKNMFLEFLSHLSHGAGLHMHQLFGIHESMQFEGPNLAWCSKGGHLAVHQACASSRCLTYLTCFKSTSIFQWNLKGMLKGWKQQRNNASTYDAVMMHQPAYESGLPPLKCHSTPRDSEL